MTWNGNILRVEGRVARGRRNRRSTETRRCHHPPGRPAFTEGETFKKVKRFRANRGRKRMVDKKLTGLGTGVLGDL